MFIFSVCTNKFVYANELPDLYGINNAEVAAAPASLEPPELTINGDEKNTFVVTADKVRDDSAKISWYSSEVYLSYTLCVFNHVSNTWDEIMTTNSTSLTVRDLIEDTDYEFAVMLSSDSTILGTVELTTGIKKPTLSVKHCSSKAVELEIGNIDSDVVAEVYKSTDGKSFEKIGVAENGSFKDKNVKQMTEYSYRVKCLSYRNGKLSKTRKSAVVKASTLKSYAVPGDTDGECKTYAYYTAVTATGSPQYKLLRSEDCYTDEETGIRMVDGFYCVALGSFYGTKIGTKYRITLKDGDEIKEINVILCDQKADRHTNSTHQYAVNNKDVVEFYVEKSKIPHGIRGDYGTLEKFSGKIIAIEEYKD